LYFSKKATIEITKTSNINQILSQNIDNLYQYFSFRDLFKKYPDWKIKCFKTSQRLNYSMAME
jgi:hypothetical protein